MTGSQNSSNDCQSLDTAQLLASLCRQAAVMERLANLLPQLIAQNQMMLQVLVKAPEAPDDNATPNFYLDGTPVQGGEPR